MNGPVQAIQAARAAKAPSATVPTADPSRQAKRARVLITPEGAPIPITIGSRSARFGALLIDLLILLTVLFLVNLFLEFSAGGTGPISDGASAAARELLYIVATIFGFAMWYGYFLVQELGPRGATFGKRIVGLRVASRDGGRLTPEAVIARNLLRDVEIFYPLIYMLISVASSVVGEGSTGVVWATLGWFLLFALFPFFNKDALRAGDVVAGTWVLEAPKTKLATALSTHGAATSAGQSDLTGTRYTFGDAELSVYGERELQTLERLLRENNPQALSAVHATICRKIGWEPGKGDERAFLEAFYAQLRARLENDMRFGKRKADKHS